MYRQPIDRRRLDGGPPRGARNDNVVDEPTIARNEDHVEQLLVVDDVSLVV